MASNPASAQAPIPVDVVIFGGGVAGLWIRARLERAGYSCVLHEGSALGSGQTIASQGIIHGGVKYALGGAATDASKAIAEMPGIWRACLHGQGELDLRTARVLSEHQYLWTTTSLASRIGGLAASKVIRTNVEAIATDQRPEPWREAPKGVHVYSVEEPVLEPRSVIQALLAAARSPVFQVSGGAKFTTDARGTRIDCTVGNSNMSLLARRIVLAAGRGNAALLTQLGAATPEQPEISPQVRPLHMVMARGDLPMIYGHCVGLSDKPRITITSQKDTTGRTVWYIGGDIAETGVSRSRDEQIAATKSEVSECLPWLATKGAELATLRVDRAEGVSATRKGERPDGPVILRIGNAIIAYPTKLAFAPLLATRVIEAFQAERFESVSTGVDISRVSAPEPEIAPLPWEAEGVQWT